LNSPLFSFFFCFQIEIEAPEEVKPGDLVPLKIRTAPHSFVGLMAIDQSVILLAENNYLHYHFFRGLLSSYGDVSGVFTMTNAKWEEPISDIESLFDDLTVFQSMGSSNDCFVLKVRKNFAETWIFDNIDDTQESEFVWKKQVPDTITSWLISGFSINDEKGIGITEERTKMKTFQPFFVSVRLPYSVKRDEVLRVPALVFNYLEKDLDVQLTLDNSDEEFEFAEPNNEVHNEKQITKIIRVPANAARGGDFLIRPKTVGNVMLKLTAVSPIAGDTIHKTLKVVPEGITQYANRAYFVNLQSEGGQQKETFDLVLPDKIVPDSEHIEFGVVGDLFGPTLNNLDNLIRLPMGCGEQTMSQYVLNMIILEYLEVSHYYS